jgi:hypothetical protein
MKSPLTIMSCLIVVSLIITHGAFAANYDILNKQSTQERVRILKAAVVSSGFKCPKVTRTMFMGPDREQAGYFSVACSNGEDFAVRIHSDAGGTMSTMSCRLLAALKVYCWKKM